MSAPDRQRSTAPAEPMVLGINLATPDVAIALWHGDALRAELTLAAEPLQAERLMPGIDALCALAGLSPKALTGLAVANGPGGFTGLRTALAAAQGLALALDIPLVGVPTLEALAAQAPLAGLVSPLLDARRGEVYGAVYRVDPDDPGHRPEQVLPGQIARVDAWLDRLSELDAPVTVLGEGALAYRTAIAERQAPIVVGPAAHRSGAAQVARLGALRIAAGELAAVELGYLRQPAAVERGAPSFTRPAPANPEP